MDVSTTTIKTLQGLAELFTKYDISIILLIFSLFFFLLANIERMPMVSLNNNPKIKYANYVIGALLLAIAIITFGAKQSPPSPPTIVSTPSPPIIVSTPSPPIIVSTASPTDTRTASPTIIPTASPTDTPLIRSTPLPVRPTPLQIRPTPLNIVPKKFPVIGDNVVPRKFPVIGNSEAANLVDNYFVAKGKIFSRAYNNEEAKKYLTGSLYTQTANSIIELQRNSAYYIYDEHSIGKTGDIVVVNNKPTITMRIYGSYKYYEKGIEMSQKSYCGDFIYSFALDEGVWKISDSVEKNICIRRIPVQ